MIDSADQLGTVSSSRRHKEDISDMASASERLFALRPVTFRYKREFTSGDMPIQFGLIAEEVAEVFPELVVYDDEGGAAFVKYHVLSTLLLNELQKLQRLNRAQEARLAALPALQSQIAELAGLRQEIAALRAAATETGQR